MMRRLWAWMENIPVGVFEQDDHGISFRYDADFPDTPISLSLPRDGGWARRNPERFLDNLLPDNPATREIMRKATGASSTDIFDLLDGADASGGLTFSFEDRPPARDTRPPVIAAEEDIAYRITALRNSSGAWWASDAQVRFSLAGNQPKFALARMGGVWFWSNASNPSTHILKPASSHAPEADMIEAATMRLAGLCGMAVPDSGVLDFDGEQTYVVERFDRRINDKGLVTRIHTEDMMQSLGLPPSSKYGVKAKDVLAMLHHTDPTDGLSYRWIRQLALNISVSNVDAHAKNYSLLLTPQGISLSPMYDVLVTTYWPWVDRSLPMRVGGATGAAQLTPRHWARFASDNHLDEDRVTHIARTIAGSVLDHAEEAFSALPRGMRDQALREIHKANANIEPQ